MQQPLIPGCLIIKLTITQNAWHGNSFHGVLYLSEAKGMDIKMKYSENLAKYGSALEGEL